jgi:hypothetical protein
MRALHESQKETAPVEEEKAQRKKARVEEEVPSVVRFPGVHADVVALIEEAEAVWPALDTEGRRGYLETVVKDKLFGKAGNCTPFQAHKYLPALKVLADLTAEPYLCYLYATALKETKKYLFKGGRVTEAQAAAGPKDVVRFTWNAEGSVLGYNGESLEQYLRGWRSAKGLLMSKTEFRSKISSHMMYWLTTDYAEQCPRCQEIFHSQKEGKCVFCK